MQIHNRTLYDDCFVVDQVTHSSGNHGQAVAHAAQVAGVPCSVVIPDVTSAVKVQAIKGYGAEAVFCQFTPQSR